MTLLLFEPAFCHHIFPEVAITAVRKEIRKLCYSRVVQEVVHCKK